MACKGLAALEPCREADNVKPDHGTEIRLHFRIERRYVDIALLEPQEVAQAA